MIKVMVFFSILMVIAAASSTMVNIQSKNIKRFKKKEEIANLNRQMKVSILDNQICDSMLKGKTASGTINITKIKDNQNDTVVESGKPFSDSALNLKIDTIEFSNIQPWSGSYYVGNFTVKFQNSDGDLLAPIMIPKFIYVIGGTIMNCIDAGLYTKVYNGNQIPGSVAASGTTTAVSDCPTQDYSAQFAVGQCYCDGNNSAARIEIAHTTYLSYYSTKKIWFAVSCPQCQGTNSDKLTAQILCKMQESFL